MQSRAMYHVSISPYIWTDSLFRPMWECDRKTNWTVRRRTFGSGRFVTITRYDSIYEHISPVIWFNYYFIFLGLQTGDQTEGFGAHIRVVCTLVSF